MQVLRLDCCAEGEESALGLAVNLLVRHGRAISGGEGADEEKAGRGGLRAEDSTPAVNDSIPDQGGDENPCRVSCQEGSVDRAGGHEPELSTLRAVGHDGADAVVDGSVKIE